MTTAAQAGQSAPAEAMEARGRRVTRQVMTWQVTWQEVAVMQHSSSSSRTDQRGTGLAAEGRPLTCRMTAEEVQKAASMVSQVLFQQLFTAFNITISELLLHCTVLLLKPRSTAAASQ
jgi:hypothetical protein